MRFQGTGVFLTYANCALSPSDLHSMLDELSTKSGNKIKKYCIVQEHHKKQSKDTDLHLHAILVFYSEIGSIKPRHFDIAGHHPNIQTLSSEPHAFKYLNKEFKPLHNYTEAEVERLLIKAEEPVNKTKQKRLIDWDFVSKAIMDGVSIKELILVQPLLLMHLTKLEANKKVYDRIMRPKPKCLQSLDNEWHFGKTGIGKSKGVWDKYDGKFFTKTKDEWWNGYEFEDVVVVPDVDASWWYFLDDAKNICDYYPFAARIKCESPLLIRPKKIIVTSNYSIRKCYEMFFKMTKREWDEELVLAMERRFNSIEYKEKANPDPTSVFPSDYFFNPVSPLQFPVADEFGFDSFMG